MKTRILQFSKPFEFDLFAPLAFFQNLSTSCVFTRHLVTNVLRSSKKFASPGIAVRQAPAAVSSAITDLDFCKGGVGEFLNDLSNLIAHIFASAVQIW